MQKQYKILGIIPARGGSKSIPKKNIALLLGKPLIYYTLREAAKSRLLDAFIVSTDDEEIAEIAKTLGADVPFLRPKEFAQDLTSDLPVFQHTLSWLKENRGWDPEILVNLRPTSPLRIADDIDKVISFILETGCDSVRTLSRGKTPFKMWYFDDNEYKISPLMSTEHYEKLGTDVPRQLLPQNIYCQNNMVDATRTKFIKDGRIYGPDIRGLIIEARRSTDIDGPDDLEKAAYFMTKLGLGPD